MPFKLVCVHPFHDRHSGKNFERGDELAHQHHVARLTETREHHFVRVAITDEEAEAATTPPPEKPAA